MSRDPNWLTANREEIPTQLRRTPTWFMASAFSSSPGFSAFDNSVLPNYSWSGTGSTKNWKEECFPDDGHDDFVGSHSLFVDNILESWPLDSLSHIEQIPLVGHDEDAGSSSGMKVESPYISVSTIESTRLRYLMGNLASRSYPTSNIDINFPRLRSFRVYAGLVAV